ncbi:MULTISPECIES: ROK family transcriptional regulator [Streptacidiphilus]|uniref:ROK family transcriptional regulator n=1 Tax=Streptacidiphilus cavernicola TaxID=3342716 RepID=A0ABV6UKI3_9ACTN|nr:ROK family transcriptional regulator [Streptacidiphilus jeojiense]
MANLTALRDHNTAAVLGRIRAADEISRVELALATGLTAQAISKIVQRLAAEGLIAPAGRVPSAGGKPRTLLRLVPQARWVVGVQLHRHGSTLVLVDLAGRIVDATATRFDPSGATPQQTLDLIAAQVEAVIAELPRERVLGVGVACPGPLDQRTGVLHQVTGLPGWNGIPLRAELAARLGLPVFLDKDTTAGVLSRPGAPDRAFVYLGDGLGAGLVLGGRVQRGARTNAGEFGHQVIDPRGPRCACGNHGCLEALCRAALADGDRGRAADLLGEGIANLVRLLDLAQVVLAGDAVLADPDLFRDRIGAVVRERLPDPGWQQVGVTVTDAGEQVVALGAAGLVLGTLFGESDADGPDAAGLAVQAPAAQYPE